MNLFRYLKLLPHEWIFGLFLVVMWVRLLIAVGPMDSDSLFFLGAILANGLVIGICKLWETKANWLIRLWFYVVAMNVFFANMKSSVLKVMPVKFDEVLANFDRRWFCAILSEHAERIATPVLTEILSFCYLLFFPYLAVSWCYYTYRGIPLLRQLFVGLFIIYGIGFLGYSFIPAGGPYLAFAEKFDSPLTGWAVTNFNNYVVAKGSNGVDVFPSLHCAVSCYLLFFDRRHSPWRFRLYLVPCIGIWIATIYLRYHYAADLLAGFALAAFALWATKRWAEKSPNLI